MKSAVSKTDATLRVLVGILVGLVVVSAVLLWATLRTQAPGEKLSLSRLARAAATGQVLEATLLEYDAQVVGRYCPRGPLALGEEGVPVAGSCRGPIREFHTAYPRSDAVTQSIVDGLGARAPVELDRQSAKQVGRQLLTLVLPPLLVVTLVALVVVSRASDGSLLEAAGLGRLNRRRRRERAKSGVSLADVAGAQHAITEVADVIDYLRDPARFQALGAPAPTGVLLAGPPGCGKTLLARAVAGQSGAPFVSMAGAHCPQAAAVRELFAQARRLAPAVCFIDDVDALGSHGEGEGASSREREQALNQLIIEMDALERSSGVVVIAATNRPQTLDPALLRRGRFDRHIAVQRPDAAGRRAILAIQAKGRPLSPEVDLDQVAARTAGFTGADLADLVDEAAVLTVRSGVGHIGSTQISEAISRVLRGRRRRSVLTPAQLTRLATHEAGHALVATALGHGQEVRRVSVVSPGGSPGATAMGSDDGVPYTPAEMADRLVMALAGAAAEEAVLGSVSTTAEDDIGRATALARLMVGRCGMSEAVGRVRVLARSGSGPDDGDLSLEPVSAATVEAFDAEVRRLIQTAEARAKAILEDNRPHLDAMVARLETEETLERDALAQVLSLVVAVVDNGPAASDRRRPTAGGGAPGNAEELGQEHLQP